MDLQLNEIVTFTYKGETYTGYVICLDYDCYEATVQVNGKCAFYKILEMKPINK